MDHCVSRTTSTRGGVATCQADQDQRRSKLKETTRKCITSVTALTIVSSTLTPELSSCVAAAMSRHRLLSWRAARNMRNTRNKPSACSLVHKYFMRVRGTCTGRASAVLSPSFCRCRNYTFASPCHERVGKVANKYWM